MEEKDKMQFRIDHKLEEGREITVWVKIGVGRDQRCYMYEEGKVEVSIPDEELDTFGKRLLEPIIDQIVSRSPDNHKAIERMEIRLLLPSCEVSARAHLIPGQEYIRSTSQEEGRIFTEFAAEDAQDDGNTAPFRMVVRPHPNAEAVISNAVTWLPRSKDGEGVMKITWTPKNSRFSIERFV